MSVAYGVVSGICLGYLEMKKRGRPFGDRKQGSLTHDHASGSIWGSGTETWHLHDLKLKGGLEPGDHLVCDSRPRDGEHRERSEDLEVGDHNLHACVCGEICMNGQGQVGSWRVQPQRTNTNRPLTHLHKLSQMYFLGPPICSNNLVPYPLEGAPYGHDAREALRA